jgi:predicted acyl esterase
MAKDWHELISQPQYKIKEEIDVRIPMRDGINLAADIFRPDSEGKFPALIGIGCYGKEIQMAVPPQPGLVSFLADGSMEAGNTDYIVPRGYVHVIVDVRGTNKSEGKYIGLFSQQEAQDCYDVIEWIAKQPWCDGNIGMVGISYFASLQKLAASLQPPHLKAIFPFDSPGDWYRDASYHGGVLHSFWWALWRTVAANNAVSAAQEYESAEEFQRLLEEAKANPDIRQYPWLWRVLEAPSISPHFLDLMLYPTDGPYYWERSIKYDKIKIPTYAGSHWPAYLYWHLPGAFRDYLEIDAPKKLIIVPRFFDRPWSEIHDVMIRWYDHWLKGIDTGIMEEPPIRIWVNGVNTWHEEYEWPLKRTKWTKFYLRSWERLTRDPETTYYHEPDCFVQMPPTMTDKIQSLRYLTSPLLEDVEVTGPMALYLHAAIDQTDTNWIITIKDVDPSGSEIELTRGWLKASHRAIDKGKSKPWQLYHPHLKPEPVNPGEISEYQIEIRPMSNVFKKGHCIMLEIACLDFASYHRTQVTEGPPYHICSSKTTLHKIYRDAEHPSYLLLPVIPT